MTSLSRTKTEGFKMLTRVILFATEKCHSNVPTHGDLSSIKSGLSGLRAANET